MVFPLRWHRNERYEVMLHQEQNVALLRCAVRQPSPCRQIKVHPYRNRDETLARALHATLLHDATLNVSRRQRRCGAGYSALYSKCMKANQVAGSTASNPLGHHPQPRRVRCIVCLLQGLNVRSTLVALNNRSHDVWKMQSGLSWTTTTTHAYA